MAEATCTKPLISFLYVFCKWQSEKSTSHPTSVSLMLLCAALQQLGWRVTTARVQSCEVGKLLTAVNTGVLALPVRHTPRQRTQRATHCGKACSVLLSLPELLASPDERSCAALAGSASASSGVVGVTRPALLSASWSPADQREG